MPIEIPQFWKLLLESELLTAEHCQQLGQEYGNVKGAAQQGNARTLSEWLVAQNILSRYQATLLLAGRPGPFVYGDYKVYDLVEKGRLAGQFRAVHGMTGYPVLLRFLAGDDVADGHRLAQLRRRVNEQFEIDHRNLHRCYELVDLPDFKFLVFDDLRGDPLETHLTAGRFAPADAAYIVHAVASALAELHRYGLTHGDVRPHHIWLESSGNLRLLRDVTRDPVSYALNQSSADDQTARADYLAPEMGAGDVPASPLTDIYALGCTFYHMLTGRPPFAGGSTAEKLSHHATSAIEPLEPHGVPQPIAQIVAYMMAKNPSVRYQVIDQVAEQLAPYADQERMQAPAPQPPASLGSFLSNVAHRKATQPAEPVSAAPVKTTAPASKPDFPDFSVPKNKPAEDTPSFDIKPKEPVGKLKSADEASESYAKKKEKTPKDIAIIFGGIAAVIIAIIVGVQFMPSGETGPEVATNGATDVPTVGPEEPEIDPIDPLVAARPDFNPPPPASGGNERPNEGNRPAADQPDVVISEVADDGETLWAPPTSGDPIDFSYVPPGGQIFLIARPAEMIGSPEGQRVLNGLGAQFDASRAAWERMAGVSLNQVEQVIISLHDNKDQFPKVCSVVHLATPMTFDNLLAAWGNPQELKPNSSLYSVGGQVAWLPREAGGKVFVIGPREEVEESAEFGGAAPPLRREVEKLRATSDAQRHFTMIFAPNYLFSGGRAIFSGERQKLLEPVDQFLGDGLQAVMINMQFGQQFYVEAKLVSEIGTEPGQLASNMRDRLAKIPNDMENYVVSLNPHPYWKRLALRYPQMIRYMHRFTRVGTEGDHAVINTVMPGVAAHNLVQASELAMVSQPGAIGPIAATPTNDKPATLDDALKLKLSVDIPQTSLEFAMRDLANDIRDELPTLENFEIVIIGPDLQLNGITRNQQIRDFKIDNKPVEEILTALCMKANPLTTVKDPSETDQKLLWVKGPDPANASRTIILITTRDSAAKKNYTLPPAFQPKSSS